MINSKDIIFELLIAIFYLGVGFILMLSDYPFLIIPLFIIVIIIKAKIKNNKKILQYVKADFEKLGFELLNERAAKFSELKFSLSFEPTVGGMPISRYKYIRRFTRIFEAKNREGKKVILNSIITKKWDRENHIEIISVKNVYPQRF